MTNTQNQWTEEDSRLYQEIASVAVPARAEQIATLLTLLPFNRQDSFHAVEVGCGEGILSEVLLACFPNATVTALDGSEDMLVKTSQRLDSFNQRVKIEPFDLALPDWHTYLHNADCVLSSLVIHHLDNRGKRDLYTIIYNQLSPRGALLIADLIEPQRPEVKSLFASTWDHTTKVQAIAEAGSVDLFEKFEQLEWNYYRYYDPFDKPSHLFDQLLWLKETGFTGVDCFWLQAGHAIYGGYKAPASAFAGGLRFEDALQTAQAAARK